MKKFVKKIAAGLLSLSMILTPATFEMGNNTYFTLTSINVSAATSKKIAAPQSLTAKAGADNIKLSWKKVSGASAYNVYMYNAKTKKYEKVKAVKKTSYTISDLESDTAYKFKVSALKKVNGKYTEGSKSKAVTVTTLSVSDSTDSENSIETFALPYQYYKLSKGGKKAYLEVRNDILTHKKQITVNTSYLNDVDEFVKIIFIAWTFDPVLSPFGIDTDSYKVNGDNISYDVTYTAKSASEDKQMLEKARNAAKEIADKIANYDEYEKILYIYDYIANNCIYKGYSSSDTAVATAYGCLVNKKANCEGMSKAFSIICAYAGITETIVYGDGLDTTDNETHIWNKVKYDGKWYNIDVTWDNATSPYDSFKKICKDSAHDYFMVSDTAIKKTHTIDDMGGYITYPAANDDSKTYYAAKGLAITEITGIDNFIYKQLVNAAENGEKGICFSVSSDFLYEKIYMRLYNKDREGFFKILTQVSQDAKTDKKVAPLCLMGTTDMNTVMIYLFYENTPLTDYFTEEEIAYFSEDDLAIFKKYGIE